tara:strand:+ start:24 stop:1322 length:1299 start_codon:yes stop_codon:yes gene_type:complete
MARQIKKLPLAISLAIHIGGLSWLLYAGIDSYEETKRTGKNISVSVISVSEFDSHMSKDPNPLIQKLKFANIQNFSKSAHENPIFKRIFESNPEVVNLEEISMLRNPTKRSDEFKRRDTALKRTVMDKVASETGMVSETLKGFKEGRLISEISLPTKLVLENSNSELLNYIQDKKVQPHREVRFIKPEVLDDVSIPAVETILNAVQEKVSLSKFELNDSVVNGFKLLKLHNVKKAEFFSKVAVNRQIKNDLPVSNKIQKIVTPKKMRTNLTTVIDQENENFSQIDKSLQRSILNDVGTSLSSPPPNQDLGLVLEILQDQDRSKETKLVSVPKSTLEEPISSSWGSAIEQTILSNLVYPKKAQNRSVAGKVHLKLEILWDGTIVNVLIRHSSGHAILDEAARAAVLKSNKLPAAPNNYPSKKFVFNLPVRFSV